MAFCSSLSSLEKHFASVPTGRQTNVVKTLLQQIMDFQQVLWRTDREITFFGAFKAGKSTLINAIMGEGALPSRANRATGVITRIGYSPERTVKVIRRASKTKFVEETVPNDDIAKYILLDVSETISKASLGIEAVSLHFPLPILRNRCILVDTPGLMDNQALTERTYQELEKSDLAVMVLSAEKLLSEVEKEAVTKVHQLLNGNIVFIVNRLDLVDEEDKEEILEWARTALEGIGNSLVGYPCIFFTQAKGALAAKQRGVRQGTTLDGLLAFEEWLERILNSSIGEKMAILSRLGILESYLLKASWHFQSELISARKKVKNLIIAEEEALAEQQANLAKTVMEDQLRINSFKARLDQLGENLVRDCIKRVGKLIDSDKEWPQKIQTCLISTLQEYPQNVYRGIQESGLKANIRLPEFDISKSTNNPEVAAAENTAETLGFWIGVALGIAAPGAWFIGAPIGATVGSWLGKNLFGVDPKKKTLESIEQTVRSLLPTLKAESEQYLNKIEILLSDYGKLNKANIKPSDQIQKNKQIERYYTDLVNWCNDFQNSINKIKKEVTK